jgi:hypothetical protein
MSRSSRTLSNPEVLFHSEGAKYLGGSGVGRVGDEGPATGEVTCVMVGTGLRVDEVTGLCVMGESGGEAI